MNQETFDFAPATSTAAFSPCRRWRYDLWRRWAPGPFLMVIGLNPSTADETQDDPTIRRCINYAKAWGFGAYCMTNLFAWRDTDPAKMKAQAEPIGRDNDATIARHAAGAGLILAAWGVHGAHLDRGAAVLELLAGHRVHCLGTTQDGNPRHPLYMPKACRPLPYARP